MTSPLDAATLDRLKARNQSVHWVAILKEIRTFSAHCCDINSGAIMGVAKEPVIRFTLNPNPVCLTADISWDLTDSYAPGSTITSWEVDWDDTTSDSGGAIGSASGTHTYAAAGLYTVEVTIVEGLGKTTTHTYEVNVLECGETKSVSSWSYASTDGAGVFYTDWTVASPEWTAVNDGLEGDALFVQSLVMDPKTRDLGHNVHILWIATDGGLYTTSNGGGTWSRVLVGDPTNAQYQDMPPATEADLNFKQVVLYRSSIFVATQHKTLDRVWMHRSDDDGLTWVSRAVCADAGPTPELILPTVTSLWVDTGLTIPSNQSGRSGEVCADQDGNIYYLKLDGQMQVFSYNLATDTETQLSLTDDIPDNNIYDLMYFNNEIYVKAGASTVDQIVYKYSGSAWVEVYDPGGKALFWFVEEGEMVMGYIDFAIGGDATITFIYGTNGSTWSNGSRVAADNDDYGYTGSGSPAGVEVGQHQFVMLASASTTIGPYTHRVWQVLRYYPSTHVFFLTDWCINNAGSVSGNADIINIDYVGVDYYWQDYGYYSSNILTWTDPGVYPNIEFTWGETGKALQHAYDAAGAGSIYIYAFESGAWWDNARRETLTYAGTSISVNGFVQDSNGYMFAFVKSSAGNALYRRVNSYLG